MFHIDISVNQIQIRQISLSLSFFCSLWKWLYLRISSFQYFFPSSWDLFIQDHLNISALLNRTRLLKLANIEWFYYMYREKIYISRWWKNLLQLYHSFLHVATPIRLVYFITSFVGLKDTSVPMEHFESTVSIFHEYVYTSSYAYRLNASAILTLYPGRAGLIPYSLITSCETFWEEKATLLQSRH